MEKIKMRTAFDKLKATKKENSKTEKQLEKEKFIRDSQRAQKVLSELKKYFYVVMRSGNVHEIENSGRNGVVEFTKQLQNKKLVYIQSKNITINSVDVVEVLNRYDYVLKINKERPKVYILDGKTKELQKLEVVKEEFIKDFESSEVFIKKFLGNGDEKIKLN